MRSPLAFAFASWSHICRASYRYTIIVVAPRSIRINNRHAIDLYIELPGRRGHLNEDPRRVVAREIAVIDRVERGEVRRLGRAIDIALEHIGQRRAGRLQAV